MKKTVTVVTGGHGGMGKGDWQTMLHRSVT